MFLGHADTKTWVRLIVHRRKQQEMPVPRCIPSVIAVSKFVGGAQTNVRRLNETNRLFGFYGCVVVDHMDSVSVQSILVSWKEMDCADLFVILWRHPGSRPLIMRC